MPDFSSRQLEQIAQVLDKFRGIGDFAVNSGLDVRVKVEVYDGSTYLGKIEQYDDEDWRFVVRNNDWED